jgi:hypothetical protein
MRAVYRDDPEGEEGEASAGGRELGAARCGGLDEDDAEGAAAAALASDCSEGMYAEGERALQVAVQLFRAGCSSGRGVLPSGGGDENDSHQSRQSPLTDGDRAEWRRAAALLERHAPGAFWIALRTVIAAVRRMDAESDAHAEEAAAVALAAAAAAAAVAATQSGGDVPAAAAAAWDRLDLRDPEVKEAGIARRGELGWELLFVAAGMWRAEGYESPAAAATAAGVDDAHGGWVHHAWEAVSELLESSPLPPAVGTTALALPQRQRSAAVTALHEHFARRRRRQHHHHHSQRHHRSQHDFDPRAYAASIAHRVAALTEAWPRQGRV